MHVHIYKYIHAYIFTYLHTYMHTYLHTYMHSYLHACMHTYLHACMHACMHTHAYVFLRVRVQEPTYERMNLNKEACVCAYVCAFANCWYLGRVRAHSPYAYMYCHHIHIYRIVPICFIHSLTNLFMLAFRFYFAVTNTFTYLYVYLCLCSIHVLDLFGLYMNV